MPLTVIYVGAKYSLLNWANVITGLDDPPLVHSVSYGNDERQQSGAAYMQSINLALMKAGVRGISILIASGDSGAANQKSKCPNKTFVPKWPVASPYVTGVGGTGGFIATRESAAGLSSGGFSNRYKTPTWQKAAVKKYLASGKISNKTRAYINNTHGRGFPDVSAQAIDFLVVVDFIPMPVLGTSCAAPTFSGIVGLLNDKRALAGKNPLGFLNPLLYQNAGILNDITAGAGSGCFSNSMNDNGFPAVPGWDAVTGLGTPNYPRMFKGVVELP